MNRVSFERPVKKREEERKKRLWKEKLRRRRLSAKKAEARRIAMERRKKRGKEKRQRAKEDSLDGEEDGSEGWGIDILGYLWPKPNLEEKKSSQRRLWIEEQADIASDRIFVSDDETYEFYGFNTTYLDKG